MKWKTVPNCLLTAFLLMAAAEVKGIPVFGSQRDEWSLGAIMRKYRQHRTPSPFGITFVTHLPVLATTPSLSPQLPIQLENKARKRRPRGRPTKRPPEPQTASPPKRAKVAGTWIPPPDEDPNLNRITTPSITPVSSAPSSPSANEEAQTNFPELILLLRETQGSITKGLSKRNEVPGTWTPPPFGGLNLNRIPIPSITPVPSAPSSPSASEETEKYFPDLLKLLREPQGSTTNRPSKRIKVAGTWIPPPYVDSNQNRSPIPSITPVSSAPSSPSGSEEIEKYFNDLLKLLREPQGSTTKRPSKRNEVPGIWTPPQYEGPNQNRITIPSITPVPSAAPASEETEKYFPDLLKLLREPQASTTKRPSKRNEVPITWIPPPYGGPNQNRIPSPTITPVSSTPSASEETEKYFPDLLKLLREPQGSTTKRPSKRIKVAGTWIPPPYVDPNQNRSPIPSITPVSSAPSSPSGSEEIEKYFNDLVKLLGEPQGSTTKRPSKRNEVPGIWTPPPYGGPNQNRIPIPSITPVPSAAPASEETEKYFPDLLKLLREPQGSTTSQPPKRNEVPITWIPPPYGGPNLNPRGVRMAPPKTTTVPPWRIPLTRRPPPRYDPQKSSQSGVLRYLLSYR